MGWQHLSGLCTPIWPEVGAKDFNSVANLLAWVLYCEGVASQLHYLDDFLLLGAPYSDQGAAALRTALHTFHSLGVPKATHKTEGPDTTITFLGIIIDTHCMSRN